MLFFYTVLFHSCGITHFHLGAALCNHSPLLLVTECNWGCLEQVLLWAHFSVQ